MKHVKTFENTLDNSTKTEYINFRGVEFEVEFDYSPEQKEVKYGYRGGTEGLSEEFEIKSIIGPDDSDWIDLIPPKLMIDAIKDKADKANADY